MHIFKTFYFVITFWWMERSKDITEVWQAFYKNLPIIQEIQFPSLGWDDSLEEEIANPL